MQRANWCNEPNCSSLQVLTAHEKMAHESFSQILIDTNSSWYVKGRQQANALERRVTRQDKGKEFDLQFICFPMFSVFPMWYFFRWNLNDNCLWNVVLRLVNQLRHYLLPQTTTLSLLQVTHSRTKVYRLCFKQGVDVHRFFFFVCAIFPPICNVSRMMETVKCICQCEV